MRCSRCLLPAQVPGADLDDHHVCAFCRAYRPGDEEAGIAVRRQRARDLDAAIEAARAAPGYQALVCLSGGKDSLYLLHRMKVDYGLRVLAFTVDANIPDVAWNSIRLA